MSDVWTVQVAGQIYGPYPLDHMKAFIAEGRIVAKSLVAYGSSTHFHSASEDLILSHLLPAETASEIPVEPEQQSEFAEEFQVETFHDAEQDTRAHVLIFTDLKSRSTNAIEDAIYALGPAFPVLPQVWLVMTKESVHGIRKMLSQRLGSVDTLFVVDASNDQAAWFNFAPEQEARIRRVWKNKPVQRKTA